MKHSVIYTKPVVSYDPKTGEKHTIAKGSKDIVTDKELAGIRHAVRIVKEKPKVRPLSDEV